MRRTPSTRVPPSKPPIRSTPQRTMQAPWDRSHRIPCSSAKPKKKRQAPLPLPPHPTSPPSSSHLPIRLARAHQKQKNSTTSPNSTPHSYALSVQEEIRTNPEGAKEIPGFSLLSLPLRAVPPRPRRQPPPSTHRPRNVGGSSKEGIGRISDRVQLKISLVFFSIFLYFYSIFLNTFL